MGLVFIAKQWEHLVRMSVSTGGLINRRLVRPPSVRQATLDKHARPKFN